MRKFPWKSWEEWEIVYQNFFAYVDPEIAPTAQNIIPNLAFESQIRDSVKKVTIWEIRGHLPKMVELTKNIFTIWLDKCQENTIDAESLKYLIAAHIIRAVNAISDHFRISRAKSISTIASEICLPQLLVDLRHDSTHKDLPSLEVLKAGLCELLKWLYLNYWQTQMQKNIRERQNCQKILDFIQNFGKNTTETEFLKHNKKSDKIASMDGILEIIKPLCGELSFYAKCKIYKCLIKEILGNIEYRIEKENLGEIIKKFIQNEDFNLNSLKEIMKLRIKRSILFISIIQALEGIYKENAAKIFHSLILKKIIKHCAKNLFENYEESLKYAILYKFIVKHSEIQLKSLIKSSNELQNKINQIIKFRYINIASQSVYNTISSKLSKIIKIPEKLKEVDIFSQKIEFIKMPCKQGKLLEKTFRKRKNPEISENNEKIDENNIEICELINGRKILCIE